MAYTITEARIGMQPIAVADTTQNHALGTIVTAQDPTYGAGEFIYCKGVASTVVGDWVVYTPVLGTTVRAVANSNGALAVAMSVCNTTTKFGWYQISGTAVALGLTSITHSTGFLWLAGSASVDDASVIGDAIINARKTTTVHVAGTFLDTYVLSRPFSTNRVLLSN